MSLAVITLGTFDLFHRGHIMLLRRCRELAGQDGLVYVGLNSDLFIKQYRFVAPFIDYAEREASIMSLGIVDEVVENNQETCSIKPIYESHPFDMIVIGSDWARKDYYEQIGVDRAWFDDNDISLCYVPYTKGVSSGALKRLIGERYTKSPDSAGATTPEQKAKGENGHA